MNIFYEKDQPRRKFWRYILVGLMIGYMLGLVQQAAQRDRRETLQEMSK